MRHQRPSGSGGGIVGVNGAGGGGSGGGGRSWTMLRGDWGLADSPGGAFGAGGSVGAGGTPGARVVALDGAGPDGAALGTAALGAAVPDACALGAAERRESFDAGAHGGD